MGLETLAIASMAGGQAYGGISAYQQGKDEERIAKYNAAVMEQEAKATEAKTEFDQMRAAEESERTQQTLETNIGASGSVSTLGSSLLAQAVQASENELKNLMIGYEGQLKAQQLRNQAQGYRLQGKYAKRQGRNQLIGSLLGAGGTVLSGFYTPQAPPTTPVTTAKKPAAKTSSSYMYKPAKALTAKSSQFKASAWKPYQIKNPKVGMYK